MSRKKSTSQSSSSAAQMDITDVIGKPLYSVRDIKSGSYGSPFMAHTDGAACRMIVSSMDDPKSMLNKFASDFELWRVGHFDEDAGHLSEDKNFVCQVNSLKEAANEAKS